MLLSGCGVADPPAESESRSAPSQVLVGKNPGPATKAIAAATAWLGRLEVDPVALVDRNIKGKKKLGEILSAYVYLRRYSDDPDAQKSISRRLEELAAHTLRPEYHNMLTCGDHEFGGNIMSYFRVAWVLDELGRVVPGSPALNDAYAIHQSELPDASEVFLGPLPAVVSGSDGTEHAADKELGCALPRAVGFGS